MGYRYDLFISYSTDPSYRLVKELQSFLEGFHSIVQPGEVPLAPLRVFVDESDLIQPGIDGAAGEAAVRQLLHQRLREARLLLVVCSNSARESPWVNEEITWFLRYRTAADIHVAVTAQVSIEEIDTVVPPALLQAGVLNRPFFDFRGHGGDEVPSEWRVRSFEEQRLALLAYLYGTSSATLAPLWRREAAGRRREIQNALAGALQGNGQAALKGSDPQRAATYLAAALVHHETGGIRSALLEALQRLWRYNCVGGQHRESSTDVICWSSDGALVAGGLGRVMNVWDHRRHQPAAVLRPEFGISPNGAAFSPIEPRLLLWGQGWGPPALGIWDASTPEKTLWLGQELKRATAAWSPGGDRIAVWSPTRLQVLDLEGKAIVQTDGLPLASNAVPSWSPSGERIACLADGELRVWNAHRGTLECSYPGVREFAWRSNDRLLITEPDRVVIASDSEESVVAVPPPGHKIIDTHFPPSGRHLLATLSDSMIGLLAPGSTEWILFALPKGVYLTWALKGDQAVAATDSGFLLHIQVDPAGRITSRELDNWHSDLGIGRAHVAWSPDDELFAAAARGRRLGVWRGGSAERLVAFDADLLPGIPIRWAPDGSALAAGSMHGELQVWMPMDNWQPKPVSADAHAFAWSPGGERAATLTKVEDRHALVVFEEQTGRRQEVPLNEKSYALAWPSEGELLLRCPDSIVGIEATAEDCHVAWTAPLSKATNSPLDPGSAALPSRCLQSTETRVFRLIKIAPDALRTDPIVQVDSELSPDGRFLCVREQPDTIRIHHTVSGIELGRLSEPGMAGGGIIWAPTGSRLAIYANSAVNLVEIDEDGITPAWSFVAPDIIRRRVWSPSGSRLALGLEDGTIVSLDLARGVVTPFSSKMLSITEIAWAPDETRIAAATTQQQVKVFHTATGLPFLELPGSPPSEEHRYVVSDGPFPRVLDFSKRGVLAFRDRKQRVILWDLTPVSGQPTELHQRVESLTGTTIVDGEALDARDLFQTGIQLLLRGELTEGWSRSSYALTLAPNGRRHIALYAVAKAALEGLEAGRPFLAQAWETDRSVYTYLWLRAAGIEEPLPYDDAFLRVMVDHLTGRIDDRELWRLAREERDSEARAMAGVAISRRLDLAGEVEKARNGYRRALGMRIVSIDELWIKLRLLRIEQGPGGRLMTWMPRSQ
jgi:WD40 repeat protein